MSGSGSGPESFLTHTFISDRFGHFVYTFRSIHMCSYVMDLYCSHVISDEFLHMKEYTHIAHQHLPKIDKRAFVDLIQRAKDAVDVRRRDNYAWFQAIFIDPEE